MAQLKWQLIFLAIFYLFYQDNVEVQATPMQRIVNGSPAVPKQFPYQVFFYARMRVLWIEYCGGTIISKRSILTAAHCIKPGMNEHKIYLGAVNKSNDREPGQQHLVVQRKDIVVHPEWNSNRKVNDIALIRLPVDLQFNEYIQPANLPNENQFTDGAIGVVSGWGKTSYTNVNGSQHLLHFNAAVLSNEECKPLVKNYYPELSFATSWICTKPSKSSPCHNDSGGPLAIRSSDGITTLLGIVSFGMDDICTVDRPGIFTRVSSYLKWIKQNQ